MGVNLSIFLFRAVADRWRFGRSANPGPQGRTWIAGRGLGGYWPAGGWSGWRFGWLEAAFLFLTLLALGMRLWELDGRAMHYDEAIHLHFGWRLHNLEGFVHSPWMHGPFQIELTALMLFLFGDNDVAARLGYALFGAALVGLPYFLRDHLGRAGALCASVMLMLSPALLYFSRFGRNDIIVVFLAVALLVLMWRYVNESKDRYLYLASGVLAVLFATKETAFFVVLIFGAVMFLLAVPQLVPCAFGRIRFDRLAGPAGFLLLLVTLTMPQWSPGVGVFQDSLGLVLVNPDPLTGEAVANPDGTQGLVGGPAWAGAGVTLPLYPAPWWLSLAVLVAMAGTLFAIAGRFSRVPRDLIPRMTVPFMAAAAVYLLVFRPIGVGPAGETGWAWVNFTLAGAVVAAAASLLSYWHYSWRRGTALLLLPAFLTAIYLGLFTPVISLNTLANGMLPAGIPVDAGANQLPFNYLVAGAILAVTFLLSAVVGVAWRGGVWLACAGIFYLVWVALYTTAFTNWAGIFSGSWQSMGYWLAQQDVARGNQPWYYYLVGIPVYELLPVAFGIVAGAYYLVKRDALGVTLAVWAGATLLAYSVASEKMPWLLVNITVPFILLAGKFLGELVERVSWAKTVENGGALLLVLVPLVVSVSVYLVWSYVDVAGSFSWSLWGLLAVFGAAAILAAYLVRVAQPPNGAALVVLGISVALLGFGAWTAGRAAYTYDDSSKELLVYAQGSADLPRTFQELEGRVFPSNADANAVRVDYDLWYPFQWYVRQHEEAGSLVFSCLKAEGDDGWHAGCASPTETPDAGGILVEARRSVSSPETLGELRKEGPHRNLLWFPETYRRPDENRGDEEFGDEFAQDLRFFGEAATSRHRWREAMDYILLRRLDSDWFSSEYYSYLP